MVHTTRSAGTTEWTVYRDDTTRRGDTTAACVSGRRREDLGAVAWTACNAMLAMTRWGDTAATRGSVSDCQNYNVYCSIIIVGLSEEVKSQVQGSHEYELLNFPKRQRAKCKVL